MLSSRQALLIFIAGQILSLIVGPMVSYAASGDAAGTYTVTVTKVEISNDGGTTYTTLFDGSTNINIASASAGAVAAGLVSGVALVPGVYNRVRVTIGANLLLKGYVNNGTTTIYTNGGTDTNGFANNNGGGADSPPNSGYDISTFTIPAGSRTNTFTVDINITPGGKTVSISFDTSGVITQSGGTPSVSAPTVSISTT